MPTIGPALETDPFATTTGRGPSIGPSLDYDPFESLEEKGPRIGPPLEYDPFAKFTTPSITAPGGIPETPDGAIDGYAGLSSNTSSADSLVRDNLFQGEDQYFKDHPEVTGMASDDDRVIINPYAKLTPEGRAATVKNETARVFMRQNGEPTFNLTPEQEKFLDSNTYKDATPGERRATIAARILSGDPSAGTPTAEQTKYVEGLKRHMGLRADGTQKGDGFLGRLQRPDGKVSTELSIGVSFEGKETEIPLLVPTLTREEINRLLAGEKPDQAIIGKAVDHAKSRMARGLSPFHEGLNADGFVLSSPTDEVTPRHEPKGIVNRGQGWEVEPEKPAYRPQSSGAGTGARGVDGGSPQAGGYQQPSVFERGVAGAASGFLVGGEAAGGTLKAAGDIPQNYNEDTIALLDDKIARLERTVQFEKAQIEGGRGVDRRGTIELLMNRKDRYDVPPASEEDKRILDANVKKLQELQEQKRQATLALEKQKQDPNFLQDSGRAVYDEFHKRNEEIRKVYPMANVKDGYTDPGWWVQGSANAAESLALGILAGSGSAARGALAGSLMEAAPGYVEMRDQNPEMRGSEALARKATYGAAVYGLEKIGLEKIFEGSPTAIKKVMTALTEGTTEYLENPAQVIADQAAREGVTITELGQQVLESLRTGADSFIFGTIGGAAAVAGGISQEQRQAAAEAQAKQRAAAQQSGNAAFGRYVADQFYPERGGQAGGTVSASPMTEQLLRDRVRQRIPEAERATPAELAESEQSSAAAPGAAVPPSQPSPVSAALTPVEGSSSPVEASPPQTDPMAPPGAGTPEIAPTGLAQPPQTAPVHQIDAAVMQMPLYQAKLREGLPPQIAVAETMKVPAALEAERDPLGPINNRRNELIATEEYVAWAMERSRAEQAAQAESEQPPSATSEAGQSGIDAAPDATMLGEPRQTTTEGVADSSAAPATDRVPIDSLRNPRGQIGNQGVSEDGVRGLLRHLGMTISDSATMREMVEALRADATAQQKLRDLTVREPIKIITLPDDSVSIQDGHHRAFLMDLIGESTIPAIDASKTKPAGKVGGIPVSSPQSTTATQQGVNPNDQASAQGRAQGPLAQGNAAPSTAARFPGRQPGAGSGQGLPVAGSTVPAQGRGTVPPADPALGPSGGQGVGADVAGQNPQAGGVGQQLAASPQRDDRSGQHAAIKSAVRNRSDYATPDTAEDSQAGRTGLQQDDQRAAAERDARESDDAAGRNFERVSKSLPATDGKLGPAVTHAVEFYRTPLGRRIVARARRAGHAVVVFVRQARPGSWNMNGVVFPDAKRTIALRAEPGSEILEALEHEVAHGFFDENNETRNESLNAIWRSIDITHPLAVAYRKWYDDSTKDLGGDPITDARLREEITCDIVSGNLIFQERSLLDMVSNPAAVVSAVQAYHGEEQAGSTQDSTGPPKASPQRVTPEELLLLKTIEARRGFSWLEINDAKIARRLEQKGLVNGVLRSGQGIKKDGRPYPLKKIAYGLSREGRALLERDSEAPITEGGVTGRGLAPTSTDSPKASPQRDRLPVRGVDAKVRASSESSKPRYSVTRDVAATVLPGTRIGTSNPSGKKVPADAGVDATRKVGLELARTEPNSYRANAIVVGTYSALGGEFDKLTKPYRDALKAVDEAEFEARSNGAKLKAAEKAGRGTVLLKMRSVKLKEASKAARDNAKKVLEKTAKSTDMSVADQVYRSLVNRVADNLVWLYDQASSSWGEAIRERARLWYVGANKIAQGFASTYQFSTDQAAGVLAVLSPQKDWFMNVDLARRVMSIYREQQNSVFDQSMADRIVLVAGKPELDEDGNEIHESGSTRNKKIAEARIYTSGMVGRKLADLNNTLEKAMFVRAYDERNNSKDYPVVLPEGGYGETRRNAPKKATRMNPSPVGENSKVAWGGFGTIAKAVAILEDGSIENISSQLGEEHKVRNFYNNIIDPMNTDGDVTMDTHAIAAALLLPLSGNSTEVSHNFGSKGARGSNVTGVSGTYPAMADAYRDTARRINERDGKSLLAREVQSITWEAIRAMFTADFKAKAANVDAVRAVWSKYENNHLTIDEARAESLRLAGGIRPTEWSSVGAGRLGTDAAAQPPNDAGQLSVPAGNVGGSGPPATGVSGGSARGVLPDAGGDRAAGSGLAPKASPSRVTPAADARYLELAKDPEKNGAQLQAMVDQAAKAAGYNVGPVYHGTNSEFNEFRQNGLNWFSTDKTDAEDYDHTRIVNAYLKLEKTADLDSPKVKRLLKENGFEDDDLYTLSQEGALARSVLVDAGYDSAKTYRGDIGDDVYHFASLMDGQIKASDPITRDDSGSIIPLSARFNEQSEDIRYSPGRKSAVRRAPNGKPSRLTETQWHQVRTPEFKAWFGDWEKFAKKKSGVWSIGAEEVSKVVDENGEPRVVHHGTTKGGFSVFEGSKHHDAIHFAGEENTSVTYSGSYSDVTPPLMHSMKEVEDAGMLDHDDSYWVVSNRDGMYLRKSGPWNEKVLTWDADTSQRAELFDTKEEAETHAASVPGGKVSEWYRPHDKNGNWTYEGTSEADAIASANYAEAYEDAGIYSVFLNLREPLEYDAEGRNWDSVWGENFGSTWDIEAEAKHMNVDGFIVNNVVDHGHGSTRDTGGGPDTVYGVFKPTQIKSATNNTGKFDPKNRDIRYSPTRPDDLPPKQVAGKAKSVLERVKESRQKRSDAAGAARARNEEEEAFKGTDGEIPPRPAYTGTKRSITDQMRERYGLEAAKKFATQHHADTLDQALKIIEEDPRVLDRLVEYLAANGGQMDKDIPHHVQTVMLAIANLEVLKEAEANARALVKAHKSGDKDALEIARKMAITSEEKMQLLVDIERASNRLAGLALNSIKITLAEDMSLGGITRRFIVYGNGADLTDDVRAVIAQISARYEKLIEQQQIDQALTEPKKINAAIEAFVAEMKASEPKVSPLVYKLVEEIVGEVNKDAEDAWADLRASSPFSGAKFSPSRDRLPRYSPSKTSGGVDPAIIDKLVRGAAQLVIQHGEDYEGWKTAFLAKTGPMPAAYGAQTSNIYKAAVARVKASVSKRGTGSMEKRKAAKVAVEKVMAGKPKEDPTPESVTARIREMIANGESPSPAQLRNVTRELARMAFRSGITDRTKMVEEVHKTMKGVMAGQTVEETGRQIAGYGIYKLLDKDAIEAALREDIIELQNIAKLEDMAKGKAPLRTGGERQLPSDEGRRLIQKVEEEKRKGGYVVTDPARELRTSLEASKRAVENAIADLEEEIRTKTRILKTKTVAPTDAELDAKRKRRDELKKLRDAMLGPRVRSPAEKIRSSEKAIERLIKEYEARKAEGRIGPENDKTESPWSPKIAELRKLLESAKTAFATDPNIVIQQAIQETQQAIDEMEAKVKAGGKNHKAAEATAEPWSPELGALKRRQAELREIIHDLQHPEKTQDQKDLQRIDAATKALDRSIEEVKRQIATGESSSRRPREQMKTPALDAKRAELEALRAQRDVLQEYVRQGMAELGAKTPEEMELDRIAAKEKSLEKSIGKTGEKVATGKYEAKEGGTEPWSPKIAKQKAEMELLQLKARRLRQIADWKRKLANGEFEPKAKKEPKSDDGTKALDLEFDKVRRDFYNALLDWQDKNRSALGKAWQTIENIIGTARAITTSVDLPPFLRQGLVATLSQPIISKNAWLTGTKAIYDEATAVAVDKEIQEHPEAKFAKAAGLFLHTGGSMLSKMEEQRMSRWIDRSSLPPDATKGRKYAIQAKNLAFAPVRASQRGYTTYLNKLRFDMFVLLTKSLAKGGDATLNEAKIIANFINVSTGRGNLAALNEYSVGLATIFFAPRYDVSRWQLLIGQPLWTTTGNWKDSKRARILIGKQYIRTLVAVAALTYVLRWAFQDDDDDENFWDFLDGQALKILAGDTRIDMTAGVGKRLIMLSRIANSFWHRLVGGDGPDTARLTGRYFRGSLAPAPSVFWDWWTDKHFDGSDTTTGSLIIKALPLPLLASDIKEAMEADGIPTGAAASILMAIGAGGNTYDPQDEDTKGKRKLTVTPSGYPYFTPDQLKKSDSLKNPYTDPLK